MWSRILALSAIGLGVGACSIAAPTRVPHRIVTTWPVDPAHGAVTLALSYAPEIKVGASRIITTNAELRAAWKYFGFREPLPELDFRERFVAVFVEGGPCSDRGSGRGGRPVLAVAQAEDGSILPLFEEPAQVACEEAEEPTRTGFAYAVAVPRSATPPSRIVLGHNSELARVAVLTREFESVESSLSSSTGATLVVRPDGTPVWIVRHADGSASALGSDYEPFPESLPGLRFNVGFSLRARRFDAPFDEWGTHLSGTRPGLERYALSVRNGRIEVGEALGKVPPGRPRVANESSYSVESSFGALGAFDGVAQRSVHEARTAHAGTLSVVSARVRIEPSTHAVLCAPDATSANDCAPVRDVRAPRGCSGVLEGNFAVRSDGDGGVEHLVGLSRDVTYACLTEEGSRPPWPPGGAWGMRRLTGAASFGAFSGFASSEFQLGAELAAALRFRHSLPAPRSFARAQLGEVFELALRARWFDDQRKHGDPAWALGVEPTLLDFGPLSHWSTPTLLGLLLPEVGVITEHRRHRGYLAWRVPFEYRESPRRQRPYTVRERVAWFVTPEFVLALGDGVERWRAGAAAGFSVW